MIILNDRYGPSFPITKTNVKKLSNDGSEPIFAVKAHRRCSEDDQTSVAKRKVFATVLRLLKSRSFHYTDGIIALSTLYAHVPVTSRGGLQKRLGRESRFKSNDHYRKNTMNKSYLSIASLFFIATTVSSYANPSKWTADKNSVWEQTLFVGAVNRQLKVCYTQGDALDLAVFLDGVYVTDINPGQSCLTVEGKRVLVRAYKNGDPSTPTDDLSKNATGTHELLDSVAPAN